MRRALFGAFLGTLLLTLAAPALADVAPPPPARPAWDDTPLPMPQDPGSDLGGVLAVVLVGVGIIGVRGRRRVRAA